MANSVFLGASPFTVNGSAITIPTGSTFGWADAYFSRLAAGQIGINADSTHGVVLDVNTDGRFRVLTRAGADTASLAVGEDLIAGDLVNATRHGFVNTGVVMSSPSDGDVSFFASNDQGVRLNFDTAGTAHFLATDGADTATVRANKLTAGANASTTGAINLANAAWIYARNAANNADAPIVRLSTSNEVEMGAAVLMNGSMLFTGVHNAVDIGTNAARPRTVYAGTSVVAPAYTVGSTAGATGTGTNVTCVNGIVTAIS